MQNKKRAEPKPLSITPSEDTHFRVILSSEAMTEETDAAVEQTDSGCSLVKPEPRTVQPEPPPEASPQPGLISATPSVPPPHATELFPAENNSKSVRKTRWTSSPPSRKNSGGSSSFAPDAKSSPVDSPAKRRGTRVGPMKSTLVFW